MPTYVFVEPIKPRQRKKSTYHIQAIDRESAFAELAKVGITEFEHVEELAADLVDSTTLATAESLEIGLTADTTRLEASVSVLLRISDIGRVAKLVIGESPVGGPYRAYFKAFGVERSPKGVRIEGFALVAPPDPEIYTSSQGEGVRKWLAENIEQIELAPEDITIPDIGDYGTINFSIN